MDASKLAERIAASPEYLALKSAPPGTRPRVRIVGGRPVVEHEEIPLDEIAAELEARIAGEETPTERLARIALEAVDAVRAASKKLPPEAEAVLAELRGKHGKRQDKLAKIAAAKAKGDRAAMLAIMSSG